MNADTLVPEFDPCIDMLIIDDDLHVLAVLEDLFSAETTMRVKAMTDSREAISLIRQTHFDLVITDLMMPRSDGLAVTRAVQETSPETLVIMITGFASLETSLEAIHLGVYDYITKPFQIDEFRLLVANAAKRVLLERECSVLYRQLHQYETDLQRLQCAQQQLQNELEQVRAHTHPLADALPLFLSERIGGGHSPSDEEVGRARAND